MAAVKGPKVFAGLKNSAQVGLGSRIIGPVFKLGELGNSDHHHNRNNGYGYCQLYKSESLFIVQVHFKPYFLRLTRKTFQVLNGNRDFPFELKLQLLSSQFQKKSKCLEM
jgi:hypothetical protein